MSPVEALRAPLEVDLAGFVGLLRRLRVPHRVVEQGNQQVLMVADPQLAEQVRELYRRYPQGVDPQRLDASPGGYSTPSPNGGWRARLLATPVTAAVLLAALAAALLTQFGKDFSAVRWLTFVDFRIQGEQVYFVPLSHSLEEQWWRLFSPMLLHFGILHLAMNALWYWELGRRIETRHNGWILFALTLLFSLASNVTQYGYAGPSLFGGLSGVLYGLLGYCWIMQKLAPQPSFALPPGVVGMMLIWLLVCMSGLVGAMGFGQIANAAHVGGLLAGCLCGALSGTLARLWQRSGGGPFEKH